MSTVTATGPGSSRNGMPLSKPYVYRGPDTELSPAEITARLRGKGDKTMTTTTRDTRDTRQPGTGNDDDDLDGVVTRPEPASNPLRNYTTHLNARMRALGWDQAHLQDKAAITPQVAARAINGTGISLSLADKIAGLLGSTLAAMIADYVCSTCAGETPAGFLCLECGTEGARR